MVQQSAAQSSLHLLLICFLFFLYLSLPRYTCIFQCNCASVSLHLILHMPHFFFLSHLASTCVLYTFMFSHPSLYLSLSRLLTYSRSLSLYFISSLFMSLSLSAHLLVMPLSLSLSFSIYLSLFLSIPLISLSISLLFLPMVDQIQRSPQSTSQTLSDQMVR